MKTKFRLLVGILLFTAALTSCSKGGDEPIVSYTVTFDADGGIPAPQAQTVIAGEKATAPTNPAKQGFVFLFWHLNSNTTAYNFATPVNSDVVLQAKWEDASVAEYWQVSWELNGGTWPATSDNPVAKVEQGSTLAEPAAPTKTGSSFDGWYKESAFVNKVTFPSTVTSDFKLYARWKAASTNVYVAGYVENEKGNRVGKVWKNGTELYTLTDGEHDAVIRSIYVSGSDVYVAGSEDNAAGIGEGRVWKNGEKLYSFTGGTQFVSLYSICVAGANVYVAGEMRVSGSQNASGKVWKNGTELYSFNNAGVTKMCISNNDIYACGYQSNGSNAKVWKNGTEWWTSDVFGYNARAHHIYASGNNIYISMNWTSSTSAIIAKINQGATFEQLYSYGNLSNPSYSAEAVSFAVSGSDVYAAVNTIQNFVTQGRIYKNGSLLYELGGTTTMYLFGNEIYYVRTYRGKITVYKNETQLYILNNGTVYDSAEDIFVVEN